MSKGDPYPNQPPTQFQYPPPPMQAQPPPPPGYGFSPQPHPVVQSQAVVVVQQPNTIRSKYPAQVTCPFCHANVVTATAPEVGIITWVSAGIILLVGCWLGCCFIPFCMDDLQNTRHDCPNCKRTIHLYKPM